MTKPNNALHPAAIALSFTTTGRPGDYTTKGK